MLANLILKVETHSFYFLQPDMDQQVVGNYLRTHRRRIGLSQREVAEMLGQPEWNVGRHERSRTLPPLLTALSYEVIFQEPVASIFSGAFGAVTSAIESNIAEYEKKLATTTGEGGQAEAVGAKLQWLRHRRRTV